MRRITQHTRPIQADHGRHQLCQVLRAVRFDSAHCLAKRLRMGKCLKNRQAMRSAFQAFTIKRHDDLITGINTKIEVGNALENRVFGRIVHGRPFLSPI